MNAGSIGRRRRGLPGLVNPVAKPNLSLRGRQWRPRLGAIKSVNITYDEATKAVIVHFRWQRHVLPGPYLTRELGIQAGEVLCRSLGWKGRGAPAK